MAIDKNSAQIVTLQEAQSYTHTFQNGHPNETKAFFAGLNKLNLILEQKGCIGIRIYNGQKPSSTTKNLVLVGVNDAGEDMELGPLLEHLIPCPPTCASTSSLLI
ncbi:MAG: hypothetical protein EOP54_00560 [Sphingobacteriales bacterium]|nr:MAG: hypothetical protein EOP54_00560 [Sphingobacteriales bacterium]